MPTSTRTSRIRSPRSAASPAAAAVPTGRVYAGIGAQERTAARRERFVEAGIELFGTLGFRATTVRGVCVEAGLTDRYFYESFDTLEALLVAVYGTLMRRLRERLEATLEAHRGAPEDLRDIERRCTAGYEVWFDMVSDRRFARIVLHEMLGVSPAVDALYEAQTREFADLTAAPIHAALPQARLPAERRALIGRALVGASIQVAATWMISGYRQPRREVVHTCVLVAMGTLRALADEAASR
jgi:AcrR family transcriptional regulator